MGENHVITLIMSHLSAAQQTPPNSSVSLLPHICNSSQLLLYLSLETHSRLFPLLSCHLNIYSKNIRQELLQLPPPLPQKGPITFLFQLKIAL